MYACAHTCSFGHADVYVCVAHTHVCQRLMLAVFLNHSSSFHFRRQELSLNLDLSPLLGFQKDTALGKRERPHRARPEGGNLPESLSPKASSFLHTKNSHGKRKKFIFQTLRKDKCLQNDFNLVSSLEVVLKHI